MLTPSQFVVLAFIVQLEGVDLFAVDRHGRTALHLAAARRHSQAVFLLLDVGGVKLAEVGDHDGLTALQIAAMEGEVETIRILVQAIPTPVPDPEPQTASSSQKATGHWKEAGTRAQRAHS